MDEEKFSFEDLEVWEEAVDFADQCLNVLLSLIKLKQIENITVSLSN